MLKELGDFCARVEADQHRPQQKWIRDMLFGMLNSRTTMLSEIGRALNEPMALIHTEKRLSRNLNSDRLDDDALLRRHLEITSKATLKDDGKHVVIAVDYTDLNKPYANMKSGMELVCQCRDGSEGAISKGYPVSQVEAYLPDGTQRPVLYRVFSYREEDYRSEYAEHIETVKQAAVHVGPEAWWTFDRGFDNERYFDGLHELGLHWIIRLKVGKNARHMIASGTSKSVGTIAREVERPWKLDLSKRKTLSIGLCHVQVSKTSPIFTLVVVDWPGKVEPLTLLVGEQIEGRAKAVEIVRAYMKRWKAEEATRSMKESRGWGLRLEDLRALTFRGVQRLVLLGMLAYSFMAEFRDKAETVAKTVVGAVKSFGAPLADIRYQLMRGIGTALAKVARWQMVRWRSNR